jgi:hypothetical protein
MHVHLFATSDPGEKTMRRLAGVVSVLGLMGLLVASEPAAFGQNKWVACVLAATMALALRWW